MTLPQDLLSESREPLWSRAKQRIREQVEAGELLPGHRLASERELCEQLGISRVTLRKALIALVEEGILAPSHGRGWFIASSTEIGRAPEDGVSGGRGSNEWPHTLESFTETAGRMKLTPSSKILTSAVTEVSIDVAEMLAVAPGSRVFRLERVRFLDGVPVAVDLTIIPEGLAPNLENHDFTSSSLFAALAEEGLNPTRADVAIGAESADDVTSDVLNVLPSSPLLMMTQVAMEQERPLFYSRIRYAGERYRLRTSFMRA